MRVTNQDSGLWKVVKYVGLHNHNLVSSAKWMCMPVCKNFPVAAKMLIDLFHDEGIPEGKTHGVIQLYVVGGNYVVDAIDEDYEEDAIDEDSEEDKLKEGIDEESDSEDSDIASLDHISDDDVDKNKEKGSTGGDIEVEVEANAETDGNQPTEHGHIEADNVEANAETDGNQPTELGDTTGFTENDSDYASESDYDSPITDDEEGGLKRVNSRFPSLPLGCDLFQFEHVIGMKFGSKEELKELLKAYVVTHGYDIRLFRSGTKLLEAVCKGCDWRLWATWMQCEKSFQIKSLKSKHECSRSVKLTAINAAWLAKHYFDRITTNPKWTLSEFQKVENAGEGVAANAHASEGANSYIDANAHATANANAGGRTNMKSKGKEKITNQKPLPLQRGEPISLNDYGVPPKKDGSAETSKKVGSPTRTKAATKNLGVATRSMKVGRQTRTEAGTRRVATRSQKVESPTIILAATRTEAAATKDLGVRPVAAGRVATRSQKVRSPTKSFKQEPEALQQRIWELDQWQQEELLLGHIKWGALQK
ncbi:hypothetical protein IFM89_016568 [Coptis chinensis]|uniref:Transposase MuDR plant domain-containing protein n=1 Tax=Coptis chinensis TaxID=261450 RepID=A0A835I3L4_9MAGN|nr:hypothetical protein IFM89_016568 [Coptis chinensis]